MKTKQKTIIDVLNESGRKILEEVKADSYQSDLLDLISSGRTIAKSCDSEWTNLGRKPKKEEIHAITSEEMILENKAILKGGRKVYWVGS